MSGPLDGIRVIDFTHVLAGPACAHYLAQLGADVIKVESPRGDAMRHRSGTDRQAAAEGMSTAYRAQGGGKRSVVLDLETDEGAQAMRRLLEWADVLVENHRPETLQRLGLDEASTRAINPALIHCAMTGYGRAGPLGDAPAYDVNIQAASGLMSLTGTAQTGPLRTGAPIIDYSVALAAGFAIAAALFQRARTGAGQFIDVSMFDTAHALMTSTIADYSLTGNEPTPRGNGANSRSPSAGTFSCKEGLLSLGVNEDAQFDRLAKAIDRADWLVDPRYATASARHENRSSLAEDLIAALALRTAAEWERLMLAAKVPAACVRTLAEAVDLARDCGRTDGPEHATLPFRLEGSPAVEPIPAPTLGADTELVLVNLESNGATTTDPDR